MDFLWPPEYLEYQRKVIDFAKEHLQDDIIERDLKGEFNRELWKTCADFGIIGLASPAKYGGNLPDINLSRAVLAIQGLGYGCKDVGLVIGLNAHMFAVQISIVLFGTEEQKKKFLPPMIKGDWIGAHGLTETESGSDVFNMNTTAKKVDGGYILNGEKCLVTLATIADVAVVFANVKPELGKWGVTAFLVENGMDGFERSPVRAKMGLRTVPIGELIFNNCFVPDENRLGPEGAGFSISNHSLEFDRCCILAGKLGAMERQLEENIKYVKDRNRFDQPIGKFQSVSNRIADMKMRIEISKLLLYKMAWLKDQDKPAMLEAAMLKLFLSESYVSSSLDSIRNFGGIGYLTEYGIERDLRDSIGGLIYAGTSDIQRNIIAKYLGL